MNTEEKIVARALEMFNERGIEYAGLREIAATLDIRVSNITYYFPSKDDLVNRLALELNKLNAAVLAENGSQNLCNFLMMYRKIFNNHVKYRCLLLSFVHLMEQNKVAAKKYRQTSKIRRAAIHSNLQLLSESGYLNIADNEQLDFMVSMLTLLTRFWISEAAVSFRNVSPDKQVTHYISLLAKFLIPYATAKGKNEIKLFLGGI